MATTELEHLAVLLRDDATLAAILTGGVYVAFDELEVALAVGVTSDAWDTTGDRPILKPCAVLSTLAEVHVGSVGQHKSMMVRLAFYEKAGYENTRAASARARALLDPAGPDTPGAQHGPLDDGSYFVVVHEGSAVRSSKESTLQSGRTIGSGVSYEADQYRVETEW